MNTIQIIRKMLFLFAASAILVSCDDDDATVEFDVIGDVFTVNKMINDEMNYATVYFAYANQPMSSAEVMTPDGNTIQLTAADAQKYTFAKEPTNSEYSTTPPSLGTYNFTVVNESIEHTITDITNSNTLQLPTITNMEFNDVTQALMVSWDSLDGADSYLVQLYNESGVAIYIGPLLSNESTGYTLDSGSGTWGETPTSGETYKVELRAFRYESSATNADYVYNIEEISITEEDIIWAN